VRSAVHSTVEAAMNRPIFSDYQKFMIRNASLAVPSQRQDEFIARVAAHLAGTPTDLAVSYSINLVYDSLAEAIDGTSSCCH
jgi:hypothetical protein